MSGKPAARVGDPTACPLPDHSTNPIAAGSSDVFFDGLAAAREGDASECGGAMVGGLASTVWINGKPAATVDSVGNHGNKVTAGSSTVLIGNAHSPAPFVAPLPVIIPGVFNRVFAFKTASGKAVERLNFRICSDSGIEKFGTALSGMSGCFSTGQKAEPVSIFITAE